MARAPEETRFIPHVSTTCPSIPENLQTCQRLLSLSRCCHRPLPGPEQPGRGADLSDPQEAHFTKSAAKLYSQASEHLPNPPAGELAFAPRRRDLALLRSLLWKRCQAGTSRKGQCPPPRPGGSPREVSVNYQCAQSYRYNNKTFFFFLKEVVGLSKRTR